MKTVATNRKTKPETWGVLAGVVLGLLAIPAWHLVSAEKGPALRPGRAVSAAQIRSIAGAIDKFALQKGGRPGRLALPVQAGLLGARDLFDSSRNQVPQYDADTGGFTENPDVVHFSALLPSDPNNLVLLCTLFLHSEGDSYHVVFNDGRYEAMNARELIQAMNRTYSYIASRIGSAPGERAATRPSP
jgi:hypothetical protein